jgi:hypothetical protein
MLQVLRQNAFTLHLLRAGDDQGVPERYLGLL